MPRKYSRRFPTFDQRFWSKVNQTEDCWLWTASVRPKGYGQIKTEGGNPRPAHVVAFEMRFGPVPNGHLVCHTCDVHPCVRNDGELSFYEVGGLHLPCYGHLWLGTPKLNSLDMVLKGRQSHGPAHRLRTSAGLPVGDAYWTPARLRMLTARGYCRRQAHAASGP